MSHPLISHIGIAVSDLDQAIRRYRTITGQQAPVVKEVADQRVKVAIFSRPGGNDRGLGGRIELLAATAPDSPIASFLARKGEGLHHICIFVENIEDKLSELKAAGVRLIDETPRTGAEGGKIAFVHPSDINGVLIELEEVPK